MKDGSRAVLLVTILVSLMVAHHVQVADAACNPIQLAPCASAITSSSPPSRLCCQRIRQQRPCLCGYMKNPTFRPYVANPNARRVASTCKTPFPRC